MKGERVKASLKKSATTDTSEIKANVKSFLENRNNANKILEVIAILESTEEAQVVAAIRGLHKIFTAVLQLNEMQLPRPVENVNEENLTTGEKYILWLQETYRDVVSKLLELMHHDSHNIQELCLCSLMKLVAEEGAHPIIKTKQPGFPRALYKKIVDCLITESLVKKDLIDRAQEFMEYDDVRAATMSCLMDVLKRNSGNMSEIQLKNIFSLLQILSMPEDKEEREPTSLVPTAGEKTDKGIKAQKRQYGNLWIEFLKNKLTVNMYKRVLVILHDKVMPHMANPVSLCDFLTHAYNIGGAISLLALNGLFVLIQKHHLNYPDFYTKLYYLLDENVLHVKYRARFFYLTDLFLTSSHLPVYLVGAFIKRLSRLSLSAPTDSLLFVLPLIYNLMIRHPNTKRLIHAEEVKDCDSDPFKADEPDPAKCNALESSLWELKTLQMHYHPEVANMARKMNKNLPEREYDISERLETTYDQLISDELDKPFEKVHMAYEPVKGLFSGKNDVCEQFWTLDSDE